MKKYLSLLIASLAILLTFTGCGNMASQSAGMSKGPQQGISQSSSQAASQDLSQGSSQNSNSLQKPSQKSSSQAISQKSAPLDEHGTYDSARDVADFLLYYHKLPDNYMTKSEARKKGWQSGALNQVIPGKCIGGDEYLNLEGALPKNATYHECDIDTLNAVKRGRKRLVWSDDFRIYYTEDHYETFELIGEE